MSTLPQDPPADSSQAPSQVLRGRAGRRGLPAAAVTFRLALTALLSVAALGLVAASCGDSEEDDGPTGCVSDLECGLGFVCDPVSGGCLPGGGTTSTNGGTTSTNGGTTSTNGGTTSTNGGTTGTATNNGTVDAGDDADGGTNNDTTPDADTGVEDADVPPDVPDVPDVREPQGCELTGCPELMVCDDFDTSGDSATFACEENANSTCVTDGGCLPGRFCVEGTCTDDAPGCRDDLECGAGAYCNRAFDACEQNICDGDDDCAGTRVCFIQDGNTEGFCGVCTQDDQCEGNLVCNFGLCEEPFVFGCQNDGDCPGTRTCEVATGQCLCGSDADCAGNDVCDTDQGICTLPPCAEDRFAPNGFFSNAAEIEPGLIDNLGMCDAVDDWFLFEVEADDGVIVELRHDNPSAGMEMDLRIDDATILGPGTQVDAASTGYLNVTLAETGVDGEIYLRTRLLYGAPVDYSVNIEIIPGGFCVEDSYETENGQSTDTRANPVDLGDRLQQPIIDANLCTADEDWYVYNAPNDDPWRISVEFVGGDDAVGVDLYYGEELLARDRRTAETVKFFEPETPQAGAYFIRVYPIAPRHNTNYILRFAEDEEGF